MANENGSSRNLNQAGSHASLVNGSGSALPAIVTETALTTTHVLPLDRHPALVYLSRLALGSRRTMVQALRVIAALFN